MNNIIETVNSAVFSSVKEPFIIIAIIFALLAALTISFVIYEIRKNDTE